MKGVRLVEAIRDSLAKNLKNDFLQYHCQKNEPVYFIYDSRIIHIQRPEDHRADIKCGVRVEFLSKKVLVGVGGSGRTLGKNFLKNTKVDDIYSLVAKLSRLKPKSMYSFWNGKYLDSGKKGLLSEVGPFHNLKEYKEQIYNLIGDRNLITDLGVDLPNSGLGKLKPSRGFKFLIDAEFDSKSIVEIIEAAIHCGRFIDKFFPNHNSRRRNDNLRRVLNSFYDESGLPKVCAMKGCTVTKNLDAAHLRAVFNSGKDSALNGCFLCKDHHLEQEGQTRKWHEENLKLWVVEYIDLNNLSNSPKRSRRLS